MFTKLGIMDFSFFELNLMNHLQGDPVPCERCAGNGNHFPVAFAILVFNFDISNE